MTAMRFIYLFLAASLLLTSCATSPKPDAKLGVDISGVNYSDMPITYIVSDPNDSGSIGAEPLDPFAAGGSMCCFRLPKTWQPGIKIEVEILDTNRKPFKKEVLELPRYVDGKPGRLWAALYQDGSIGVLSSEYDPSHARWPGKVKGWPVPTVEYRRKLWERDLNEVAADVRNARELLEELEKNPRKRIEESWEFKKTHNPKEIEKFSGPNDPSYKEFLINHYQEYLKRSQQRFESLRSKKP